MIFMVVTGGWFMALFNPHDVHLPFSTLAALALVPTMAGTSSNRAPSTMANGSRVPDMALGNRWGTGDGGWNKEFDRDALGASKTKVEDESCCMLLVSCSFSIFQWFLCGYEQFLWWFQWTNSFLGMAWMRPKATSGDLHTLPFLQVWPDGTEYVGQWRCSAVLQKRRYGPSRVVSMSFHLHKSYEIIVEFPFRITTSLLNQYTKSFNFPKNQSLLVEPWHRSWAPFHPKPAIYQAIPSGTLTLPSKNSNFQQWPTGKSRQNMGKDGKIQVNQNPNSGISQLCPASQGLMVPPRHGPCPRPGSHQTQRRRQLLRGVAARPGARLRRVPLPGRRGVLRGPVPLRPARGAGSGELGGWLMWLGWIVGGVTWGWGEETGGLMWSLLRWGKIRKGSMDSYSLLDEARMNQELCGWFLFMLDSLWCKWENERDQVQDPKDDLISSTAIPTSCRTSFESLLLMSKTFHFSPLTSVSFQTSKKDFIPGISWYFYEILPISTTSHHFPCHVQRRAPPCPTVW